MAAEAAATTFAKASVILGAVFFALDVADLYHDAGGNLTLMAENLIHPATVAGLVTLPSLAQGAVSTAVGAYLLLTSQSMAAAGPIGIAVGLFVLAGVILLNGQTFAAAAFGTLNPAGRVTFASAMGNRTRDLARLLAFANDQDPDASAAAARASALTSARFMRFAATTSDAELAGRLQGAATIARADAARFSTRAALERGLQHAALSALEQMDDFASGDFVTDPGRSTEGYGVLWKQTPEGLRPFPYRGDLVVSVPNGDGLRPLPRGEWRPLLRSWDSTDMDGVSFDYRLTATDGIPLKEVERFIASCTASGELIGALLDEYRALAR
jgi:hypothetical protein